MTGAIGIDLAQLRRQKLLLATHNAGKLREIAALLAPLGLSVVSASEYGLTEPDETGATFADNARIKSSYCATQRGLPALSDDSGLSVDALGGEPGIYSARWAGESKDFALAMQHVHDRLVAENVLPDRWTARFVCVLSLCLPNGHSKEFEGVVEGKLVWPPRGNAGFGYDPMFVPHGHSMTFGEIPAEKKHAISHRADAFAKLVAYLNLSAIST